MPPLFSRVFPLCQWHCFPGWSVHCWQGRNHTKFACICQNNQPEAQQLPFTLLATHLFANGLAITSLLSEQNGWHPPFRKRGKCFECQLFGNFPLQSMAQELKDGRRVCCMMPACIWGCCTHLIVQGNLCFVLCHEHGLHSVVSKKFNHLLDLSSHVSLSLSLSLRGVIVSWNSPYVLTVNRISGPLRVFLLLEESHTVGWEAAGRDGLVGCKSTRRPKKPIIGDQNLTYRMSSFAQKMTTA